MKGSFKLFQITSVSGLMCSAILLLSSDILGFEKGNFSSSFAGIRQECHPELLAENRYMILESGIEVWVQVNCQMKSREYAKLSLEDVLKGEDLAIGMFEVNPKMEAFVVAYTDEISIIYARSGIQDRTIKKRSE